MLTRDDAAQAAIAEEAVRRDFQVTPTVLVEAEWVLRSAYGWSRDQRVQGLSSVLDLPHAVDVPPYARWALQRTAKGADFADMMHLGGAEGASSFATFERKLVRHAGPDSPVPVEALA